MLISRRRALVDGSKAAALLLFANACSIFQSTPGASTAPATKLRDELRLALSDVGNETFQPINGPNQNQVFSDFMFDHLVGVDYTTKNLSKTNGIASDWTVSADGLTYTFQIRPWKFHNGDELTVEDVKFTLERLRGEPQIPGLLVNNLGTVTVKGPTELELKLKSPIPLLRLLAVHSGKIMPKKYLDRVGRVDFETAPVGSGPYKFVEHKVGSHFTYEQAYPEHYGIGVPRFKRVTVRLVTEPGTRLAMLRSGEIDLIDVGIREVRKLKEEGFQAFPTQGTETLQMMFQSFRPGEATADINVRKALSYAIDREGINKNFLDGLGMVTGTAVQNLGNPPLPPQSPYDLTMAQSFLNQTPYGKGGKRLFMHMQVPIRTGWPDNLAIAQFIQSTWLKIGIDCDLLYRDYGTYRPDLAAHSLAAPSVTLWTGPGPTYTMVSTMTTLVYSKGTLTFHNNADLDRLIDEWAAQPDEATGKVKGAAMEKIINDNFLSLQILEAPVYVVGNDQIRRDFTPGLGAGAINGKALCWNPA